MNFIIYAIPIFFLLIAIELIAEKWRKTNYYRTNDAINSLSAGVLSQMTGLLKKLIPFTLYLMVFEHIQLFTLPNQWWVWLFAFVAYDFLYYWNHRLGHEINLLWAAHVVHHSSEEYNLTTALRQSSGSIVSWVFYLPLAIIGVDPVVLISVGSLNLIYQFWVHTRHIPKLGWYELFFVTPSNHRVHHAQNQIYLDRNYGGVFIIWDRIFGTFQEELDTQKPVYGIRKALQSWNPLWANAQVYGQLFKDAIRAERWQDKVSIWFRKTGWRPADVEAKYPLTKTDLSTFQKFDTELSLSAKLYAILQYSISAGLALVMLLSGDALSALQQLIVISFILFSSYSLGAFLEAKAYYFWLEATKSVGLIALVFLITLPKPILIGFTLAGVFAFLFLLVISHMQRKALMPQLRL
ncbi:MAG: alkylglycerol monooxygenase [Gammaproteobacteria bacterium]|jgi:sterol desaturase/sphingolipid hydroxylase (fatty acid hydroxylase superfamily)